MKEVDTGAHDLSDNDAIVFFQVNQQHCGGKLRLHPEIVAVQISIEKDQSPAKRARLSALF